MEPDGEHLQVQWELADLSLMPLLIVFECGDVLKHWGKADVTPDFKEDKKKGLGKNRPANLTSIPGKISRVNTAGNHIKAH